MGMKKALNVSREQLRNLAIYLQYAREEERIVVAREIHDECGQALTALQMDLSWLSKRLPDGQQILFDKIKSMSKLIGTTLQTVQNIVTRLRPTELDDLGLMTAIELHVKGFQDRTGIKCEYNLWPDDVVLRQDYSTVIFRIVQELLTNIYRHANATKVKVDFKKKAEILIIRVTDNGKGIKKEQIYNKESFGLMGIRERALILGGKVKIKAMPANGTTCIVTIPYSKCGFLV